MSNPEFKANLIIRGKIECLTGLHIGGSKEKLEIGGVDSIVVRSPRTEYPYIPGSSLKGKMRHLLEYATGAVADPVLIKQGSDQDRWQNSLGNVSKAEPIVRLFGIGADEREQEPLKSIGPSRLLVRDAHPDEDTVRMWKEDLGTDANFTEYKAENTIDRLTSAANPRFIERVVEGSKFDFEIIYSVYTMHADEDFAEQANKDVANLLAGLRLLEASALGKSGSRGYGQIRFHLTDPVWVTQDDYISGSNTWKKSKEGFGDTKTKLLEAFQQEAFKFNIG